MDAVEAGGTAPAQAPSLTHAGTRWRKLSDTYLTIHDQQELARVACADEPVQEVADLVRRYHREQRRIILPAVGVVGSCVAGYFTSLLTAEVDGLSWLSLIPFIALLVFLGLMVRAAVKMSREWDDLVVVALMRVIRELERPQVHFGEACHSINATADLFYRAFSTRRGDRLVGKRWAPRRYRRLQAPDAERGAAAIASQAWRLAGRSPEHAEAADDLRRAVLRVAGGNWRQVGDLDLSGDRTAVWVLPGLARRMFTALQQDGTLKLLGLVTAIIVLAAALSRFWG